MSKKHFIELANMIRSSRSDWSDDQLPMLADFCQSQNPRFNRQRWLNYVNGRCGPNGGKVKP